MSKTEGTDKKEAKTRTDKPGSRIGSGEKINPCSFGEPVQNGFFYKLVMRPGHACHMYMKLTIITHESI
ncbi:MAG: hypothetical protein FP813_06750 [Desulfurivibrio sp.]|nr:hypothetical protein [Desulfurivibrio sp.]